MPEPFAPPPFQPVQIEATNVSVARGGRLIARGASLTAPPGAAVLLRGPNGIGKTSLLRVLAGLLRPEAGEVRCVDGEGNSDPDLQSGARIYCGVSNAHKATLSVRENLAFWCALYGVPAQAGIEAARYFAIDPYADYLAGALSTGYARRLGLARLLIANRPVWLVDEPTLSLDAEAVTLFVAMLERHRARGGVVILAAHDEIALSDAQVYALSHPAAPL